jgi:hypothetical protein
MNTFKQDCLSLELVEATPPLRAEDVDLPEDDIDIFTQYDEPSAPVPLQPWPEPEEFRSELLPVPSFPTDIIPDPLRLWISDVAWRIQCPIEGVAIAAILSAGAIIGTSCAIRPKANDDWTVVPNLWGTLIGRPSMIAKSPALKEATLPLRRLEAKAMNDYEEAKRSYETDQSIYKLQQDNIKSAARSKKGESDFSAIKDQLLSLQEPSRPVWKRFQTNDTTIEKMNELLKENPRGILVFRDELMGWLASLDKEGHETDRAYYLEGWSGDSPKTDDRIGRGTTRADNVCISVLGGIQPAKLESYLYKSLYGQDNDGLLQRFQLMVYPNEPDWQSVDQRPDNVAKKRAMAIFEALAETDFRQLGAVQGDDDKFPHLHFAPDAQPLFSAWLTDLMKNKLKSETNPMMQEHLGKYRSLLPSLALIFHLIELVDSKESGPVTQRSFTLAEKWSVILEAHARRVYGLAGNLATRAAAVLSDKIKKGELQDGFTARDVYRNQWRLLTEPETVKSACDELVDAGWLRAQATQPDFQQKAKIGYVINPKVKRSQES